MAEEKNRNELRCDLLPEEVQFICKMCHIAANKRMVDKLACASVAVEGRLCKPMERLSNTLKSQANELKVYRKYASAFISDNIGERTVLQKNEILKIYKEKVVEGVRSVEEFADLLSYLGIEVVGS